MAEIAPEYTDDTLLSGKVAIVTGASSGMGRVMAISLAEAGAQVVGVDISTAGLGSTSEDPAFSRHPLIAVTADVSKPDDCKKAVDVAVTEAGRLDILINCAGLSMDPAITQEAQAAGAGGRTNFWKADPVGWTHIQAVNSNGSFLMAHYAARVMVAQGWGRIVNVTTSFDTMLAAGLSAYAASKSALEANTAVWAKELDGTGVTANVLVPGGPTDTPFLPPEVPRSITLPPSVMALPVRWLVSEAAGAFNGKRFIARDWDASLPPMEAAGAIVQPCAWPDLAAGATAVRGRPSTDR